MGTRRLRALMDESGMGEGDLLEWLKLSPSVPYAATAGQLEAAMAGDKSPRSRRMVQDCEAHLMNLIRRRKGEL